MIDSEYWIWLSRIEGLNPKLLNNLLKKYEGPKVLWNKTKEQLVEDGLKESYANEITNSIYRKNLDKYLKYMKDNYIELINIYDEDYPEKLKQIYDPPVVIFIKGNKEILKEKSLSIVGCRDCTKYGGYVAKKLAYNLSLSNINIVSGLAKGIDSFAHIGAIEAKGKTIAVVGCGLDTVYPKENKELFNKIIKTNGAIVSEYVIGTKPVAYNFPKRNRIISGLTQGVIVVEAKEKSGTLITVDFALEQGKEVYVVPGNITSPNSYGTNELIKQGAKIVTTVEEILEDL